MRSLLYSKTMSLGRVATLLHQLWDVDGRGVHGCARTPVGGPFVGRDVLLASSLLVVSACSLGFDGFRLSRDAAAEDRELDTGVEVTPTSDSGALPSAESGAGVMAIPCSEDGMCTSRVCIDSTCRRCRNNAQCQTSERCASHECVPIRFPPDVSPIAGAGRATSQASGWKLGLEVGASVPRTELRGQGHKLIISSTPPSP